ncbi:hypothetical protein Atep_20310 [Allochromatium tepidum]|uniref:Uncharacterized protein n=1 Tax=Allochromatium tepidum TaxID=553982 RepID=A0ABN6GCI0_9GAMM|nr:hypothetical protein Atep_20310 [Allochromatium tepidum]
MARLSGIGAWLVLSVMLCVTIILGTGLGTSWGPATPN